MRNDDNNMDLFLASQDDNLDRVLELIVEGVDANARNRAGETPLHKAAQNGHTQIAGALKEAGADVDAVDSYRYTPLHLAARYGHTEMAIALIEIRANVDAVDIIGYTPLHEAAVHGHTQIAAALLETRANIDARSQEGETPLHEAATHGHAQITEILLDAGANANTTTRKRETPLHLAAICGNAETTATLFAISAMMGKNIKVSNRAMGSIKRYILENDDKKTDFYDTIVKQSLLDPKSVEGQEFRRNIETLPLNNGGDFKKLISQIRRVTLGAKEVTELREGDIGNLNYDNAPSQVVRHKSAGALDNEQRNNENSR